MILVYPPPARDVAGRPSLGGEALVQQLEALRQRPLRALDAYAANATDADNGGAQVVLALVEPDEDTLQLASFVLGRAGLPFELFVGPRWAAAWLPHPGAAPAANAADARATTAGATPRLRAALRAGARLQWLAQPGSEGPPAHVHQAVHQLAERERSVHLRWSLGSAGVRRLGGPHDEPALPVTAAADAATDWADGAGGADARAGTVAVVVAGLDPARTLQAVRAALGQQLAVDAVWLLARTAHADAALQALARAEPRLRLQPRRSHEGARTQWVRTLAELAELGVVTVLHLPAGVVPRADATRRLGAALALVHVRVAFADAVVQGPGAAELLAAGTGTALPRPPGAPPPALWRAWPALPRGGAPRPTQAPPRAELLPLATLAPVASWRACAATLAADAPLAAQALWAALPAAAAVGYVAEPLSAVYAPAAPDAQAAAAHAELAAAQHAAERAHASCVRVRAEVQRERELAAESAATAARAQAEAAARANVQADALQAQCGTLAEQNAALQDALARLTASPSWQVTRPARQFAAGLERVGLRFGLARGQGRLRAGEHDGEGPGAA